METTLNTGPGAGSPNLNTNANLAHLGGTKDAQAAQKGATPAIVENREKSSIEPSANLPPSNAKGYPQKAAQPALLEPLPVPAGIAQSGMKLATNMPLLLQFLQTMSLQAQSFSLGTNIDNLIEQLFVQLQAGLLPADAPSVKILGKVAGETPALTAKVLQGAIIKTTLSQYPTLAPLVQKALDQYQKTGKLDPATSAQLTQNLEKLMGKMKASFPENKLSEELLKTYIDEPNNPSIDENLRAILKNLPIAANSGILKPTSKLFMPTGIPLEGGVTNEAAQSGKTASLAAKTPQLGSPLPAGIVVQGVLGPVVNIHDIPQLMQQLQTLMVQANAPQQGSPLDAQLNKLVKLLNEETAALPSSDDASIIAFANATGLSPQQAAKIIQSAVISNTSVLDASFATILQQAIAQYLSNGTLDPDLQNVLSKSINNVTAKINTPISADKMKEHVIAFLKNPNDPSIPPNIKAILQKISPAVITTLKARADSVATATHAQAVTATAQAATATPKAVVASQTIDMTKLDPTIKNNALAAINTAKDLSGIIQKEVTKLPEGPEKLSCQTYLATISAAIDKLMKMINQTQADRATIAKTLNSLTSALQQSNLDLQNAAAQESREARDSSKNINLGPLTEIFPVLQKIMVYVVVVIFTAVAFCAGGPPLAAVVFMCACSMAILMDAKPEVFNTMNAKINEFMHQLASAIGGPKWMQDTLSGIGSITTTGVLDIMISCGNPLLFLELYLQMPNSSDDPNDPKSLGGPVYNMFKQAGVDQKGIGIAMAVLNGVGQIAVAVCAAILTGGASVAAVGGEVSAAITATLVQVTGMAIDAAQKAVRLAALIISAVATAFLLSLQITENVAKIDKAKLEINLSRIKSQAESAGELTTELIEIMKKAVHALMDALSGDPDFLLVLGKFQQSKYDDLSAITTQALQG